MIDNVETQVVNINLIQIDFIEFETNFISTLETLDNVLYVRKCMKEIYQSLNEFRKSPTMKGNKDTKNAAVIGQPGIGKSCSLYYFVYMFLQEDDIDVVVLQSFEEGDFFKFKIEERKIVREVIEISHDSCSNMREFLRQSGKKAVFLVDMTKEEGPNIVRNSGLTVYSSSPAPYKKWLKGMRQKMRLLIYSPPPLTKEETSIIFDYIKRKEKLPLAIEEFEEYFDLFGGTIRPMKDLRGEFIRIEEGSHALLQTNPSQILDLIKNGPKEVTEDFTDALFSETGGDKSNAYCLKGSYFRIKRTYRSDFSNFLFRQYVAPRILFKHYTAEVFFLLYNANQTASANKGQHDCSFDELFHKTLPLGNWSVRDVPEEKRKDPKPLEFFMKFMGWCYATSEENNTFKVITLTGIPVIQRKENETEVVELSDLWNKNFGKKNRESKESSKIENKRDVAKLISIINTMERFYWLPLGAAFPGIDAVHKDTYSLNFIQVKTGTEAENHYFPESAIHFSLLLYNLMEFKDKETLQVSILLGTKPAKSALLGKRKRSSIPENWAIQYLSAPIPHQEPKDLVLNYEVYSNNLRQEFFRFKQMLLVDDT